MSQHPNKGQVLPLEQALPLLVEMRQQGRSWPQVQHALGYSSRADLNPLRWQRAAELKRDAPTLTWASIGADPAVDFAENTLAKKHKTATLATGERWEEYFARFAEATRARLDAEAESFAEQITDLFKGCLRRARAAAQRLDLFELCPQKVPAELGKDVGAEQLAIMFLGDPRISEVLGDDLPAPLSPAQQSWFNNENRSLISDGERLQKMLLPLDERREIDSADTAETIASLAELQAKAERNAWLAEQIAANRAAIATPQGVA